jgi:DNA repair exonuclease SbcCD ATPase subunit/DNA repair exonuclease SbcCD nuclease subunit
MPTKKQLIDKCKELNIKGYTQKTKEELETILKQHLEIDETEVKINCGKRKIKKIYHLADIHIKVLDRHEEYYEIFDKLIIYLKNEIEEDKEENKLVVICGDIFHTRDRLVSETVVLFHYLIENLTKILPVVLIPGNHDSFTHNDRMDIITGLYKIKKYNNLFFFNTPGIYTYENLLISYSNDTKFIKHSSISSSKLKDYDYSISLYHGLVNGAVYDNGLTVSASSSNNVLNTNSFDGYDLVLLGDIHKRQFIKPHIAYSGSLIQQSHKESQFEHGLIKWTFQDEDDLDNSIKSESINIDNDYSFITIPIINGIPQIKETNFSKYSRVKCTIDYIDSDIFIDTNEIKQRLMQYTNVISINKEIINTKSINLDSIKEENSGSLTVIPKEQTEISLIEKICETLDKQISKEKILELHKSYLNILDINNKFDNYKTSLPWHITDVTFKNVFIYGGNHTNYIDFTKMNGLIGILGNNAIGKSSLLNTILYGLFGAIYKTKNYNNRNIIHKSEKDYYIKLTIQMGDIKYIIERMGKHKKRGKINSAMEETIVFKKINENGDIINLTDTNKNTTNDKIKNTLCISNKEEFLLTNVISNVNYKSILFMSNSELEDTFNTLFNTQKYKILYDYAHKQYKLLYDKLNILKGKLNGLFSQLKSESDVNTLKSTLQEHKDNLISCTTFLSKKKALLDKCLIIKTENYIDLELDLNEEELNKKIEKLENNLNLQKDYNIESLLNERDDLENKFYILEEYLENNKKYSKHELDSIERISTLNKEELNKTIDELSNSKESLIDMKDVTGKYFLAKTELKKYEQNVLSINIDDLITNLNKLDENKEGFLIFTKNLRDKIVKVFNISKSTSFNEILYYKEIIKQKEENDAKMLKNIELDNEIASLKQCLLYHNVNEYYKNKKKYEKIDKKLTIIEMYEDLQSLYNRKNMLQKHTLYIQNENEIIKLKNEIIELEKEIITINKCIAQKELTLSNNEDLDKQITNLETELHVLYEETELVKQYKLIMSDKNLPKILIKDTIQYVSHEANKLIFNLLNMKVIIDDNLEDNGKWEIYFQKGNIVLGTEQCSGYEKFIINIALKIALDKYKYFTGIKMFFIDEALDCVAEDNLDKLDTLFDILKQYYSTILIISHNTLLKSKLNSSIQIESDFNVSKIKV